MCYLFSVIFICCFLWYFVLFMLISPLHKAAYKRNVKQCLMFFICFVYGILVIVLDEVILKK